MGLLYCQVHWYPSPHQYFQLGKRTHAWIAHIPFGTIIIVHIHVVKQFSITFSCDSRKKYLFIFFQETSLQISLHWMAREGTNLSYFVKQFSNNGFQHEFRLFHLVEFFFFQISSDVSELVHLKLLEINNALITLFSDAWLNSIMWQIYFQSNLNLISAGSSVQTLIQGRIICIGILL